MQPARHDARGVCGARAGARPGGYRHRRQCQPALATAPRPVVVMDSQRGRAARAGAAGRVPGFAVAGCEPDEMGIGPVFAVPRLLERHGLNDRRHRPVGAERGLRRPGALLPRQARHRSGRNLNVNGGSIAIGHPFGMTGARHDRARADRRQAPRRQAWRRHHVHRRRHGRGRPV